ncbi:MAG: ArsR/SmtB family transcription factor [Alphaproteobacteria bacterium]
MQEASQRAADLMRALASETRLMLLCQLVEGERSVGMLAETLGLRPSTVSQQLALLRKDGLVQTRRDAQTIYYRLAGDEARRVIEVLYDLYCGPARRDDAEASVAED